ncbi:hypothetical protein [Marinobacter similis]|uniref:hypothetical protein n=1 Tax=Marinobacter similis TaxID=1420916 RepID=UPI0011DD4895|nr:hypothetical protein [Marinobacter similis]
MFRFVLPFGDEPDFFYRAEKLLNAAHSQFSPYYLLAPAFDALYLIKGCKINSDVLSFWSYTGDKECVEPFGQALIRFSITLFICLPLIFVLVFRRFFYKFFRLLGWAADSEDWGRRADVLSLSLLFPGLIFYIGVLAEEQLVLVLSLLIFLAWRSKFFVCFLLIGIFSLDLGNGIVVLVFILTAIFFQVVDRVVGLRGVAILILLMFGFSLFVGYTLLSHFESVALVGQKASSISAKASSIGEEIRGKYPVILRPIITFMTGVFMTPSGVKAIPAYVISFLGLIIVFRRIMVCISDRSRRYDNGMNCENSQFRSACVDALAAIAIIGCFVFVLPDYANAKYYIFLVPFLFYVSSFVVCRHKILIFNAVLSVTVLINLSLYRI